MPQQASPSPDPSSYRVTLFFGPEPITQRPEEVACVFNVKKRSWKAGIQVSVELHTDQLSSLRATIRLSDRLSPAFSALDSGVRPEYEARVPDLFAQAVSWCKLDLGLQAGLRQENQRMPADELMPEVDRAVASRATYVVTYILAELDLTANHPFLL